MIWVPAYRTLDKPSTLAVPLGPESLGGQRQAVGPLRRLAHQPNDLVDRAAGSFDHHLVMNMTDHGEPGPVESDQCGGQQISGDRLSRILSEAPAVGVGPHPAVLRGVEPPSFLGPLATVLVLDVPALPADPAIDHGPARGEPHPTVWPLLLDPHSARATSPPQSIFEVMPELDDVRVGPPPLILQPVELVVGSLGAHHAQRSNAALVAAGQDCDLSLIAGESTHTLRSLDVDVSPGAESLERPCLTCEPSQYPGLDRGEVNDDQRPCERRPDQRLELERGRLTGPVKGLDHPRDLGSIGACLGLGHRDPVLEGEVHGCHRRGMDRRPWEILQLDTRSGPTAGVRSEIPEAPPVAAIG